jgi:2,4-dienoyl-CoA reductase (NADPH2)
VPEVNTREVPKWMEPDDLDAVVDGFRSAAALAAAAGLDGVEINAGQNSLLRQFLSGLTNQRTDAWGTDRTTLLRDVLGAVRDGLSQATGDRVLGLRLSCDELAPWAGITPEMATDIAVEVAPLVDYLVVVKGSIFTLSATRPDMHTEPGFNIDLCRDIRSSVTTAAEAARFPAPAIALQGSIVDPAQAQWALGDAVCDMVEMTRAQIADADLVTKLRAGTPERVRPCLLCNQTCQVRDARNPIVTCVLDPSSGHETEDPPVDGRASTTREVVVVGAGPAGLECARVAAGRGHHVRVAERRDHTGGTVPAAGAAHGRGRLVAAVVWLEAECRRLDVVFDLGTEVDAEAIRRWQSSSATVVLATGSRRGERPYSIETGAAATERTARKVLSKRADTNRGSAGQSGSPGPDSDDGPVVVLDPIGGPIGVSVAETYAADGRQVHLVTQDNIAGNELARTGDLAPANTRLQQAGVTIERRTIPRRVCAAESGVLVEVEDRFTGERRSLPASLVVDAGFRLPDTGLYDDTGATLARAGDAVAPRTIHEAVLEGRRVALALEAGDRDATPGPP